MTREARGMVYGVLASIVFWLVIGVIVVWLVSS
jgi:predicted cobalt transporter CbtA